MKDTKSLLHILIVPKYRRIVIYNKLRYDIRLTIKTPINRKPEEGELYSSAVRDSVKIFNFKIYERAEE